MIPFKNILIQIDSCTNTEKAIERAVELYEPFHTNIHLVFVAEYGFFHDLLFLYTKAGKDYINRKKRYEAKVKLKEVQDVLLSKVRGCLIITKVLDNGNSPQLFATYIKEHRVDLVIMTNKVKRNILYRLFMFDMSKVAEKANVAVLTITNSGSFYPVRSILITVTMDVMDKKIQVALMLARKYNARIHIGILINNSHANVKPTMDMFYVAYKTLMECGHPPQYKVLQGVDSQSLLLNYAGQIKADMIIVHQGKEEPVLDLLFQKMPGLIHAPAAMQIPVL